MVIFAFLGNYPYPLGFEIYLHEVFKVVCFLIINLYWSIFNIQWFVSFRCTAKWISYIYIHSFFGFFLHIGLYGVLSWVSCTVGPYSYLFYTCVYVSFSLLIYPSLLGDYQFVFYICDSIFKINSFVPFLQIPHISDILYLSLIYFSQYDNL